MKGRLRDFFIVVVSGSRVWEPMAQIGHELNLVHQEHDKVLVISGGAKGVDSACRVVCQQRGYFFAEIPAAWVAFGKKAGPIRNGWEILFEPDLVLCFHPNLNNSIGTKDMHKKATKKGFTIKVISK